MLLEQLAAIRVRSEEWTRQLRHRYLALLLDALHTPSGTLLAGPPPSWEEINERWETAMLPRSASEALHRGP